MGEFKLPLTSGSIAQFQKVIYDYYRENRRSFPWREHITPYHVFVSEVMLQQTQAQRTVSKFNEFIAAFPDFASLAAASVRDVLSHWHGLGYNRRALSLKKSAECIMSEHKGQLPTSLAVLDALPGIGHATACSISAFAFNKPVVFIETNIRSVFIHFFFLDREEVHDRELLGLVETTLDRHNPRDWYYALMDYGTMLKKKGNPSRKSKHYTKQSTFKGSDREIRGAILKLLLTQQELDERQIAHVLQKDEERVSRILQDLVKEGFILKKQMRYNLP